MRRFSSRTREIAWFCRPCELVQLQRRKASNKIRSRLFPTGTQKQCENKQLSGCSTGSGTHHTISSDKSSIHRRLKFTILATEMIWTGTSNIFHRALCFQDRWNTACNKWGRAFVQVTPARTRILAKQGTKSTVSVSVPHASSWTAWWHSRASQLSSWPLPSESSRVNRSFASNLRLPRRQQKLHQAVAIQTATVATVSFTSFHWKVNKGRHDDHKSCPPQGTGPGGRLSAANWHVRLTRVVSHRPFLIGCLWFADSLCLQNHLRGFGPKKTESTHTKRQQKTARNKWKHAGIHNFGCMRLALNLQKRFQSL